MRLENVAFHELGGRDAALWNRFANGAHGLVSPYLRFEFAQIVARARPDLRVIVAERDGAPVAYWPFHAGKGGVVRPLAAPMSDYQGVIAAPGVAIDPKAAMKAMGAGAFVYDNWATTPPPGRVRARAGSAVMDLSGGGGAWLDRRRALEKDHFRKTARRLRQAENRWGKARIEFGHPEAFAALKRWKSAQYRATGKLDLFSISWVNQVLEDCATAQGPFRGVVASLHFGKHLAAVEMGIAAGGVYHSWFPAYDPAFSKASPGLQLLEGLALHAETLGLTRIDLGKGEAAYKRYYADWEAPLFEGRALAPSLAAARVGGWEIAERAGRALPGGLAQAPAKLRRRWAQTAAFEPDLSRRLARMGEAVAGQAALRG